LQTQSIGQEHKTHCRKKFLHTYKIVIEAVMATYAEYPISNKPSPPLGHDGIQQWCIQSDRDALSLSGWARKLDNRTNEVADSFSLMPATDFIQVPLRIVAPPTPTLRRDNNAITLCQQRILTLWGYADADGVSSLYKQFRIHL
jgi:hypothetical protein